MGWGAAGGGRPRPGAAVRAAAPRRGRRGRPGQVSAAVVRRRGGRTLPGPDRWGDELQRLPRLPGRRGRGAGAGAAGTGAGGAPALLAQVLLAPRPAGGRSRGHPTLRAGRPAAPRPARAGAGLPLLRQAGQVLVLHPGAARRQLRGAAGVRGPPRRADAPVRLRRALQPVYRPLQRPPPGRQLPPGRGAATGRPGDGGGVRPRGAGDRHGDRRLGDVPGDDQLPALRLPLAARACGAGADDRDRAARDAPRRAG